MKLYLNVFYPHEADLALAKQLGFHGVRTEPPSPEDAADVMARVRFAGLEGLFIAHDSDTAMSLWRAWDGSDGVAIELGNEEDSKQTPKNYQRWASLAAMEIRNHSSRLPIFTGGIVTPNKRRLEWLAAVYALGMPPYVHTAIHTYRTDREPKESHPGFRNRAAEFDAVRRIIGPARRLIVSEVGWHTCESKRPRPGLLGLLGLTTRVRYTEEQIAGFLRDEARICKDAGVESMTVYQVTNGPNQNFYEDNFGLRRMDGSLTPAANAMSGIAQEVE